MAETQAELNRQQLERMTDAVLRVAMSLTLQGQLDEADEYVAIITELNKAREIGYLKIPCTPARFEIKRDD